MKSHLLAAALTLGLATPFTTLALDQLTRAQGQEIYDKALQSYSCVDYQKALRMFKANAEAGHDLSQYMVGIMLEQGQGTEPDVFAAFKWYMTAAKQGLADAYFALGDMYSRGISVGKDAMQAYMWFELADRGGHQLAKDMKQSVANQLKPEQLEVAHKLAQDWLAQLGS